VQADSPVEASRGRKHALRMLGGGLDAWQARVVEVLQQECEVVRAGGAAAWLRTRSEELRAGLSTDAVQSAGRIQSAGRPSKVSRVFFASTPPTYWPIEPSLRTTRWQGTTTGIGLVAHAVPTARTAFGLPTATAMAA
jgi:hypothetical protein